MKLIVQIPAYNEEETIGKVINEIPKKIKGIDKIEILVTDDASTDKTVEEAEKVGANYIVLHKHNQGLGKNFKDGIEKCLELGADIIVNIDADGQFNPKDIVKLVKPIINNESDMVTCSRFLNKELTKNMPWIKRWGNRRFTKLISKITGKKFTDTQCGFRAYSREAALRLNLNGSFTYTQEVFIDLVQKNMKIKEIPLEVVYYKKRKSLISGNLRKYGFKALGIIAKATRDATPLTFFGLPGMIVLGLGVLGGIYSLFYWIINDVTTPIKTLFSTSVFFMVFGISLGILALLADMLKSAKRTQEETLYRIKKGEYRRNGSYRKHI